MKNTINRFTFSLLLFVGLTATALAQDEPPCPPGGCDDEDPTDIPFDGGASLLIAAGIGIGGKKIYDNFQKKN